MMEGNQDRLAIDGGPPVRRKPFAPWPVATQAMRRRLLEVLDSGHWFLGCGQNNRLFEQEFARAHDCRFATCLTNGTHTLQVALLASGLEAGQEVIVPSWTFYSTAQAVVAANGVPVFADIDPVTLNINPAHIETLITRYTAGIIPVHFAGHPADMERIMAIARRHKLFVIEDAAHAHGARYHGRRAGSLGHVGSFSFQFYKNLTAGEGGALTTNDESLHERIYAWYNLGRKKTRYAQYVHWWMGSNFRMTEFQAAILRESLPLLNAQNQRRRLNAGLLNELLRPLPGLSLFEPVGDVEPSYHGYLLRLHKERAGLTKPRFVEAVVAEGIPMSPLYTMGVHEQPVFRELRFGPYTGYQRTNPKLSYRHLDLPETRRAAKEVCYLPQRVLLGDERDMRDIAAAVEKVLRVSERSRRANREKRSCTLAK